MVLDIVLKLLNTTCLTFSSHLAKRNIAKFLSLVWLNIHDEFCHSLYAFSKSGYLSKSTGSFPKVMGFAYYAKIVVSLKRVNPKACVLSRYFSKYIGEVFNILKP